jgi:hypothetical protein
MTRIAVVMMTTMAMTVTPSTYTLKERTQIEQLVNLQ